MSVHWSALIWAGLIATTFAAATFWLFRSFGLTRFTPANTLGGLVFREPSSPLAETVGQATFFVLGSTVVAALYATALSRVGGPSAVAGLLLGAAHGAASVLALPYVGMISASVRSGHEAAPARFGLGWGRATPISLMVGHLVYGGVLGA
ncbi:MAG: hypothetical protein M3409_07390, partial [Gemmatimonadota bacterium]|nr:hypothetical protein [Gemmatimonadota bacterium]